MTVHITHHQRPHPTPVPTTVLLSRALSRVDWADAFAVHLPRGTPAHNPQEWAAAIFDSPPFGVRALFGLREVVVRLVGIEPGSGRDFATTDWRPDEVLVGSDRNHLSFRGSVLVEPERVVLSTVVQLHNRRGRTYSRVVRVVHPWVVRAMLARASRRLGVTS
ncbi:MAG TPA: DUF2867 domain-containing protein [Nocardioides sp.]|uniref:DUF2867 domain-containing protein n=1 Tax=Nocardioides sp. TaxID=35761 RepID=UPI002E35B681|nr:DUF2867 domain-containing protein [Nocardioides sp.]HEX5088959.1 DUF2867 domain-containing protein [Nocardioides sp.]